MNYYLLGTEVLGAAGNAAKVPVRKPVAAAVPVKTPAPSSTAVPVRTAPPSSTTNAVPPPSKKTPGTTAPLVNTKLAQRAVASGQAAIAAGKRLSSKGFRGISAAAVAAGQRAVAAGKKMQAIHGDSSGDDLEAKNALAFSDAYVAAEPIITALKTAVDSLASKTDASLVAMRDEGTALLRDFDRVSGPEFLEQFAELKPKATDLTSRINAAMGVTTPPPADGGGGGGGGGEDDSFPPDDTSETDPGAAFEPPGSMTDAASAAASAAVDALKSKKPEEHPNTEASTHTEASLVPSLSTTSLVAGAACIGAAFFLWRKYKGR